MNDVEYAVAKAVDYAVAKAVDVERDDIVSVGGKTFRVISKRVRQLKNNPQQVYLALVPAHAVYTSKEVEKIDSAVTISARASQPFFIVKTVKR